MFSSLVTTDAYANVEPELARAWEDSEEGRLRTWHLRTDVRWHDGHPFTARDVAFTLELLSHPDVVVLVPGSLDEIEVVDDHTLRVRAARHDYGGVAIYPRHWLEGLDPARLGQWEFWTRLVGTGPYRVVRYERDLFMELEANPDYFRGEPEIPRVVFRFVGRSGIVTEALSGRADLLYRSRIEDWQALEPTGRFRLFHGASPAGRALYLNHRHPLFRDPRVRRAIALALDRDEILRGLGYPPEVVREGARRADVLYTRSQFGRGELPPAAPYDPAGAERLFDEAGWTDDDGDGVRERDGFRARFGLMTRLPGRQAVFVQEYLRRVGMEVEIETVDSSVEWERMAASDFEAAIHVYQAHPQWDLDYFADGGVTGYANPRVTDALRRAVMTSDQRVIDSLYRTLHSEMAQDVPFVLLHPVISVSFVHRRIEGVADPLDLNPLYHLEALRIARE